MNLLAVNLILFALVIALAALNVYQFRKQREARAENKELKDQAEAVTAKVKQLSEAIKNDDNAQVQGEKLDKVIKEAQSVEEIANIRFNLSAAISDIL